MPRSHSSTRSIPLRKEKSAAWACVRYSIVHGKHHCHSAFIGDAHAAEVTHHETILSPSSSTEPREVLSTVSRTVKETTATMTTLVLEAEVDQSND